MKKQKVIWERYALFACLFCLVALGFVFSPRREVSREVQVAPETELVEATPVPEAPAHRIKTPCGDRLQPRPLLINPHPLLRAHIGEFEKGSNSYLERAKLPGGVSVVFIQDVCPQKTTHLRFHFPDRQLLALPPEEAMAQYRQWAGEVVTSLKRKRALSATGAAVLNALAGDLTPTLPEWGGVQLAYSVTEPSSELPPAPIKKALSSEDDKAP